MIHSVKLKNILKQNGSAQFSLTINSLEFHNNRIQVIVGPNGSGKSTLLNLLALLDKPNHGSLFFDDKPVSMNNNGFSRLRKKIGFVRQSPYLFNIDVFANIALGLKIRKYPRGEIISKVSDMLVTLKIQHLAKRGIRNLSRGEYQKVAIARVFVLEPEIMLMDEPVANIDAQSMLLIEETVKGIQRRTNSLIIMTTHSLTQAYRMSPDIISLREGRIVDFVHENVFFGEIEDCTNGLQCMSIAERVKIVFSTEKKGKTYIAIDPENIIISKDAVKTSARNTLCGKIVKIESLGLNVRLLVDVGVQIYSIITKLSFHDLGINLGSNVAISFKVNSVEVL